MKNILKGSFVVLIFKIFGAASIFVTHIIIAREYGAEVLGAFNLILSLLMMISIFSKIGLDVYVVRIIPSIVDHHEKVVTFIRKIFTLLLIGSLISTILYFCCIAWINEFLFKTTKAKGYLNSLIFIILPYTFFNVIAEIFRGFQNIFLYAFFLNFLQKIVLLVLLSCIIFLGITINPIYLMYCSIVFVFAVSLTTLYEFLSSRGYKLWATISENSGYTEKIFRHTWPMLLAGAIHYLMTNLDQLMIGYYLGEFSVGIYAASVKISILLGFILTSINGYIAPKISQAYECNDFIGIKKIYLNSIKIIAITVFPIVLPIILFPKFFLSLFGSEFVNYDLTLLIVNITFLVSALFGPVGYILNMTDNQLILMKILVCGILVNIILNLTLIPIMGINGAAIATLVSVLIWKIFAILFIKRRIFVKVSNAIA